MATRLFLGFTLAGSVALWAWFALLWLILLGAFGSQTTQDTLLTVMILAVAPACLTLAGVLLFTRHTSIAFALLIAAYAVIGVPLFVLP